MKANNSIRSALGVLVVLVAAPGAYAQIINVNIFSDGGEGPATTLVGPAGGADEVWDQRFTIEETNLLDKYGLPTSVGYSGLLGFVDGAAFGTPWQWGTPQLELIGAGMATFQRGPANPQQFVINGLTEGRTYDVWIASANTISLFDEESNQRAKGEWTTPNVTSTVGTQTIDNVFDVNESTWVAGNNYVLFEDVVVDANGELVFDGFSIDEINDDPAWDNRLPVNGFQLIDLDPPPPPPLLTLQVNTISDSMTILGDGSENIDINSYQITSVLGQVDPGGWNSLDEQNLPTFAGIAGDFTKDDLVNSVDLSDPVDGWETRFGTDLTGSDFLDWQGNFGATGTPTDWEEGGAVGTSFLGEAILTGHSTIATSASIGLGTGSYTGPAEGDLKFVYRTADGLLIDGLISYVGAVAVVVPESSSWVLLAVGLLGVNYGRRKQGTYTLSSDIVNIIRSNMGFGEDPTSSANGADLERDSHMGVQ
jgi:hypothetical protein